MNRLRLRKAFTVVEMVIVIAVIAILSAVLIPTISGVIQKANVSADQQFAASLNIQLALWEVDNGEIKNESDLRDAINEFYGEKDEAGNLITDYYATLAPKSGKHGYHYWYDVDNKQVVVSTYEKLVDSDGDGIITTAETEPTFSPASPRSLTINEKNYFLMDQAGSDVVDQLKALKNVGGNAGYAEAIENIRAIPADADLATAIAAKLDKTVLANDKGVFFRTGKDAAEQVYVPAGTTMIGPCQVDASKLSGITEIYLPSGVSLGTNSLVGFARADDNNDGMLVGSTTIYVNATKEAVTGGMVSADATNCVIQIPTGERFAFVNGVFKQLGTDETFETEFSDELIEFTINGPAESGKDNYFSFNKDGSTIYYTPEFSGDDIITLVAGGFKNTDGTVVNRTAVWTVGGVEHKGNELTLKAAQIPDDSTITVSVQNLDHTISVVVGAVDYVKAEISGQGSEPVENGVINQTVSYKPGQAFEISTEVGLNKENLAGIAVSKDVDLKLSGAGVDKLTLSGNTLTVKDGVSGSFNATLTVTTKAVDMSGNKKTFTINMTFKAASTTFDVADNANTQDKYDITFTVGTEGAIELGTLFQSSDEPSNIAVKLLNNLNDGGTTLDINKEGTDWTKWTISLSSAGSGNKYISISDGDGTACNLSVNVVSGAANIDTVGKWNNNTNGKIVLLNNITLNSNSNNKLKSVTYLNGNGFMIKAKEFVYSSGQGYLIKLNGTIENVIINGPVYSQVVWSTADDLSMFTSGIYSEGTSEIKNSYISGFKSPIRLNTGNLTLTKSVIEGGTHSNVYVYKGSSLTLDGSVTIQKQSGYTTTVGTKNKNVIGAGVYVDDKQASAFNVTLKNDSYQYNWINSSKTGDYYVGGTAFSIKTVVNTVKEKASAYVHSDKYLNMAVFYDNGQTDTSYLTVTHDGYTGTTFEQVTWESCDTITKYYDFASILKTNCSEANCHGHGDPVDITIGSKTYTYTTFFAEINK